MEVIKELNLRVAGVLQHTCIVKSDTALVPIYGQYLVIISENGEIIDYEFPVSWASDKDAAMSLFTNMRLPISIKRHDSSGHVVMIKSLERTIYTYTDIYAEADAEAIALVTAWLSIYENRRLQVT